MSIRFMCRLQRQHHCGRISDRFSEENPMLPVKRVDHRCDIFFSKEEKYFFTLCRALIFASRTRLITVESTYAKTLR